MENPYPSGSTKAHLRPPNGSALSRTNPRAEGWQSTTHAARLGVGCSAEAGVWRQIQSFFLARVFRSALPAFEAFLGRIRLSLRDAVR